jgi:hypothetical protein
MKKSLTNYAFIDHQNIHLGFQRLGWKLAWRKFWVYLEDRGVLVYRVGAAEEVGDL